MARKSALPSNVKVTGELPMKSASGRKYLVRNPTDHDFTTTPKVEGKIVQIGSIEIEGKDRPFVVIETDKGLSRVFESKAKEDLFAVAKVGLSCSIVYQGEKDLGSGRSFQKFSVEVWQE